jgi:hypothetical protein
VIKWAILTFTRLPSGRVSAQRLPLSNSWAKLVALAWILRLQRRPRSSSRSRA